MTTADQLMADRAHDMGLAAPGQPEQQDVVAAVEEGALAQGWQQLRDTGAGSRFRSRVASVFSPGSLESRWLRSMRRRLRSSSSSTMRWRR